MEPDGQGALQGSGSAVAGRKILITGGTGSFGKTMVRQLVQGECDEIRILSRDEAKQDDMRRELPDPRLRFYIGDVRDFDSVERATTGVDFIFHAAALKQVPSCEFFPVEAVRTNVLGSENVISAAEQCGVRTVVCLSTDKAVYPINAMGMSKALMEKVAQAHARNHPGSATTVAIVRYGNVMYSRGSVLPLFVQQAKGGQQLTVTDPAMTRFMMSLPEAVALVEYAFQMARPGDLFVRKAPAATMEHVAMAVNSVVGSTAGVRVIGTRHGEKLYETLASREELARSHDLGNYFRIPVDDRDLNYEMYFSEGQPEQAELVDYNSHNTVRLDVPGVEDLLRTLPEFADVLVS
jgi:UDP-N-acetylglucosamine 4,6-dehydratase/5-epimerase